MKVVLPHIKLNNYGFFVVWNSPRYFNTDTVCRKALLKEAELFCSYMNEKRRIT